MPMTAEQPLDNWVFIWKMKSLLKTLEKIMQTFGYALYGHDG